MGEWKTEILDNLCKHIQSGGTPKSDKEEYYIGEMPFVTIEDITSSNKYLLKTKKRISEEGLKSSSAWLVPKDSLMYSIYATLGSTLISKIDAATNQAILNLIVNTEKIDVEYLYYFLSSLKNQIYKYSAQTTQSNLNAAIVKTFEIQYPESKPEQTRIVEILSTADEAIAHTEALIAKYQRIKTGLMQDLLTKGIDENGNIRSKTTHKFVVKNGIEVPEEWEVDKISNYIKFLRSGLSRQISSEDLGIPVLISGNISDELIIDLTDIKYWYLNDPQGSNIKDYILDDKDILLCFINSIAKIGKSAIFYKKLLDRDCIYTTNLFRIKASNGTIPEFLFFLISGNFVQKGIQLITKSAINQASFTTKEFLDIQVPIIHFNEQIKIVQKVNSINNYLSEQNKSLNKLQSLKTGLMQDLLNGKVRVNIENKN